MFVNGILKKTSFKSAPIISNLSKVPTKFFLKNPIIPMTLPSIFDMIFYDSKEFLMTLNL